MELVLGIMVFLAGIFAEGFTKPLQVYLFKRFWRALDSRADKLEAEAAKTLTELDDFLVAYCRENYDKLSAIVDRPDLSESEVAAVKKLAENNFRLDVLLSKLGDV